MVPGFFKKPRHVAGDRYTLLRDVELDLLDEMEPLTGTKENLEHHSDVVVDILDDSDMQKKSVKKKRKQKNADASSLDIDMVKLNSESGSMALNSSATTEKSVNDGLRLLLLPAAAIVADIAHYPLVQEDGEGVTIDDLVREDIALSTERLRIIALQIFFPFLVAGLGMVGAGMVLDLVQHWEVFKEISELFVMVPALLGLKGNLEMTLAARLSTALNIGDLSATKKWKVIGANLALTQAQAVVVGFLASAFAVFIGVISHHSINWGHALLLCGAASVTTSVASSVLGGVMVGVILLAEKLKINPDNVATPIAASLGDVITLGVLSGFSLLFYSVYGTNVWYVGPSVVLVIVWSLLPLWIHIALQVPQTKQVLITGWIPVISAMLISSGAGTILEKVSNSGLPYFLGLPVFQPVINGVAGNLVAVQASRISTHLHVAYGEPGQVPGDFVVCPNPFRAFCARNPMNARTSRLLLLILIPGHLIFLYTISLMKGGHTTLTFRFVVVFIFVALIQVAILLYIAEALTHYVWKRGIDPDSFTIPYLTSLGDLTGTAFLTFAFWFLYITGDRDLDVGD